MTTPTKTRKATTAKATATHKKLLAAAKKMMVGLNARSAAAPDNAKPVFYGIAELHAAIHKSGLVLAAARHSTKGKGR